MVAPSIASNLGVLKKSEKQQLKTLFASLGAPDFAATFAAFRAEGAGARLVLDGLNEKLPLGTAKANGRAVFEDLEHCLWQLAGAEPEVFLAAVREQPSLLDIFAFASALRNIPGAEASDLLLQMLGSKLGSMRWLALGALLERKEPRAIARLNKATRDRDGLVVFSAVSALRRYATPSDIPRLLELVQARRTAPGTREAAIDAIEGACSRAGQPLPEGTTARLVEITLPAGAVPRVLDAELVEAGAPLTKPGVAPVVVAPCRAVVVDILLDGAAPVLVLRRQ